MHPTDSTTSTTATSTTAVSAAAASRAAASAATSTVTDPGPQALGVGGRITLAVMSDDYAEIITGALARTPADGLEVRTDPVSTWFSGTEQHIAAYLSRLVAEAARGGAHVSATVMLSRGCPGEVACAFPDGVGLPTPPAPELPPTGVHALAQWALYPLDDGSPTAGGADHMRDIYAAIDQARSRGTVTGSEHYVTSLAGDVADVIGTVVAAWGSVGAVVQHVTTHVTLSVNSPSAQGAL